MQIQTKSRRTIRNLVYAAVCLALCMVLPFLTGQIPEIGSMLCPMHIPVLLAGFLCGPWWALVVGLIAPLLRHLLFSMPPLMVAIPMCFELATYGLISGLLYKVLPKKTGYIYVSLVAAMAGGRVIWGIAKVITAGITSSAFPWSAFISGAITTAVPGIILHIILIPVLVLALRKAKIITD